MGGELMGVLLKRRHELMGISAETPGISVALQDGSYASGKVIVTYGSDIALNSPGQYVTNVIPLTKSIPVVADDVLSICFTTKSFSKSFNFGVSIDGTVTNHDQNKPAVNNWYNITVPASGNFDGFSIKAREASTVGTCSISIKHNDTILF